MVHLHPYDACPRTSQPRPASSDCTPLLACPEAPDEAHGRNRHRRVRHRRLCDRARHRHRGRYLGDRGSDGDDEPTRADPVAIEIAIAQSLAVPDPDGPLAAGTYTTQPFAGPGGLCMGQADCIEAGAEDDSIRVTVTVPDGWAGIEGTVHPSVEGYLAPRGAGLLFHRGGWLYSELCGGPGPDIPTGTTVDEFVTALVDHPDLDVTSPVDVTLAGYSGKYLELRAPANTTTDELGPDPRGCNYYFVWKPGIYAQGPNALWRIWVLDVDGVRMVVRSDSFPGTTPRVQAQLAAIVDSIQIEP